MQQYGFMDYEHEPPRTERERRLARAREKEMVRSALSSTSWYGCYVFDELITEESGIIDFLVVGPLSVSAVVVRSDRGYVSLDKDKDTLLIDRRHFEDDPYHQGSLLIEDVDRTIFAEVGKTHYIVCFLYAQLEIDEDNQIPHGTTPIWELPWALDPEGVENLNPAQIEEIVEKVRRVYGRPPIITPGDGYGEL